MYIQGEKSMKKLVLPFILALLLIGVSASTASATGLPPQPQPEELYEWEFNGCGLNADTLQVTALTPFTKTNSIWIWNDDGDFDVKVNWSNQNPFQSTVDFTIEQSGFLYSWFRGGYFYWVNTGAPDPCPLQSLDCHEVAGTRWYETRTNADGEDEHYVHYYYTGICTGSLNVNKRTGERFPAYGGLWLTKDAEGNDKNFETVDGIKHSMANLPDGKGPWQVQIFGQGGIGGSDIWNP